MNFEAIHITQLLYSGGLISWDIMVGNPKAYQNDSGIMFREENFGKYVESYINDGLWELVGKYNIAFVDGPSINLTEEGVCYVMRVLN